MRRQAASLLLILMGGAATAVQPATEPSPSPVVVVRDGKVTGSLQQAPLDAVVDSIADQTGAEVRGAVQPGREVTLRLDAVPLEDALERLLGAHSFTLTYDSDGRLKRIALATTAGNTHPAAAAPARSPVSGPMDPAAAEATKRISQYVQGNQTVEVGGRLGKALGTDTATFQDVLRVALKDPDPRVRAEGRRSMVRAITGDPTVREALVASVSGMSDDVLAQALRNVAGADAARLAAAFARYGRSPELSQRMQKAVAELHRQGSGS